MVRITAGTLYHATSEILVASIMKKGLLPRAPDRSPGRMPFVLLFHDEAQARAMADVLEATFRTPSAIIAVDAGDTGLFEGAVLDSDGIQCPPGGFLVNVAIPAERLSRLTDATPIRREE